MRIQLFLVACLFSLGTATADSPHGISPGDINRKGDACNDFFDYANGAWRKENPIPDYMDRWSRRWQSGELNKEHVRSILDEVSARRDWPAGSAEQLSGDFYGACMAEDQVNQAGIAPVQSLLDEVASIQTRADVIKALDLICDYYRGNEPSSPVPLILQRAQRLVDKDFITIMTDLTPNALAQLQIITGTKPKE